MIHYKDQVEVVLPHPHGMEEEFLGLGLSACAFPFSCSSG
jgi:hypothetical protein